MFSIVVVFGVISVYFVVELNIMVSLLSLASKYKLTFGNDI